MLALTLLSSSTSVCVYSMCVRPATAVSRCVVQFMLSSLIPSGPGSVNALNLKRLVLEIYI